MILAAGMPVMESAPWVVPWYATALLITLWRDGWPVSLKYCLMSLIALSTASPPLAVKKT